MKNFKLYLIPAILFFLVNANCFGQQKNSNDERINNVENGLVKYKWDKDYTVDMIIDSKRIDTMPKLNIYDRMKDYKVPGLSIAVINDFKIDWANGYGVMEAGTDKKVNSETMFQSGSTTKVLMAIVILRMIVFQS